MHLFAYPGPTEPDILGLLRLLEADFRLKAERTHIESVAFIEHGRRMMAMARERGLGVRWGHTDWCGLYVKVELGPQDGFDAMHDLYEATAAEIARLAALNPTSYLPAKSDPDPEDNVDLRMRYWHFKAGHARFSLWAQAHYASEVCKLVEVGTQPKYEMECNGVRLSRPQPELQF